MAQVAGSLTFTTVLSLVPLLTVCLAVFTRFPVFSRFERALEEHLLRSLLRESLSRDIDFALEDAFSFAGPRCDAIVAHVLAHIRPDGKPPSNS